MPTSTNPQYLAIDIGGTKTLLALFNSSGDIIQKIKFPTAPTPTSFTTDLVANLSKLINSSNDIKSIAVAVPGLVDGPIAINLPNLPEWKGANLANITHTALAKCFPNDNSTLPHRLPIAVNNDAAIATAFEAKGIPGKTIYLTISTGIGGGIAIDGKTSIESHQFEPGHTLYDWQGHPTEWEQFASAKAVERAYNDTMDSPENTPDTPNTPENTPDTPNTPDATPNTLGIPNTLNNRPTATSGARILATDLTSPAELQDIAHRLSIGLADLITQHHPDTIILGGPLGQNLPLYHDFLLTDLKKALSDPKDDTPDSNGTTSSSKNTTPDSNGTTPTLPNIIKAKLPQESTIYGCFLFARHLANAE